MAATSLHAFLAQEALPAAGIDPAGFWDGVARIIEDLTPVNRALLARRDELQAAIDDWHRAHAGQPLDIAGYRAFLTGIGYLADDPGPFQVAPLNVDPEISSLAGPQLVVPVNNARFAINAANARWGSLYDALYGTDVIAEDFGATRHGSYNPVRGERVIGTVRDFLDEAVPLAGASHREVIAYAVSDGSLVAQTAAGYATLADPAAFAGYDGLSGRAVWRTARHHGLHMEILIDRAGAIGCGDPPAFRTSWSRPRSPRSSTSRTRSPRWTRTTRSPPTATGSAYPPASSARQWRRAARRSSAASRATARTPARTAARSPCPAGRCCSCAMSAT